MSNIRILKGAALSKAIKGAAAKFATFGQFVHEIAYGALLHCAEHNDACHMNAVVNVTPERYRGAVVAWFKEFSNAAFDSKTVTFTYNKKKTADTESALATGPMEWTRAKKDAAPKSKQSLMERSRKSYENTIKADDASRADKAFAKAMLKAIEQYERSLAPAATVTPKAANTSKKPAKAKTAKSAAPVAAAA